MWVERIGQKGDIYLCILDLLECHSWALPIASTYTSSHAP